MNPVEVTLIAFIVFVLGFAVLSFLPRRRFRRR